MNDLRINEDGFLDKGQFHWHASPHFDERSGSMPISLIVIHNISLPAGCFGTGYVQALFDGTIDTTAHPSFVSLQGLEVSSHFFIDRNGEIWQFVSTQKRAWHAGKSSFMEHERCNDFSIGIELEGTDFQSFQEVQYASLRALLKAITERYPKIKFVTGHSDIAPGRKTDPGLFFSADKALNDATLRSKLKYWHLNVQK